QYGHAPDPGPGPGGTEWWLAHIHPADRARVTAERGAALAAEAEIWGSEYRFARADGSYARVIDRTRFQRDASGQAIRAVGSLVDVTALLEGEERFRLAAEAAKDVIYTWSPRTAETWRSPGYAQTFGLDPAAPARGPGSWHDAIHPEDLARIDRMRDTALASGEDRWECSYRIIRGDGSIAHVIDRALAQRQPDGRLHRIIGSVVDVTGLREEEDRLRALIRVASDVVYDLDPRSGAVVFSDSVAEVLGPDWLGPQTTISIWQERLHPDDRERAIQGARSFIAGRDEEWRAEYRLLGRDGETIHIRDRALALRDEDGRALRIIGALEDITAETETAMKLSQSQRLEALGKLTGGVAHDFNNLLSVVLGNAELLAETDATPERRAMAEAVVRAAMRGADLVRSLLAFARRQPLRPQVLDTDTLLVELRDMLDRTLPAHIRLRIAPGTDLWTVKADPAQLQTALLNLAVNAADAMPAGGDLLIEAEDVHLDSDYAAANPGTRPGAFLRLSISDTGLGMTPEVVARAFDPFFTTKEVGHGSGLGLSMVHGFASQSGGHVTLYSEPGRGTTVRLYLPRSEGEATAAALLRAQATRVRMGAGEHVIVAEDDPALRPHVARLLESLGYRVTAAADGEAALAAIRAAPDARLLFSDVVMPGDLNGIALATQAVAERPGLKVLLTSGYTEQAIRSHTLQARHFPMLPKPYRRDELAARLREVLEEEAG
ncbi:MAG: PAS domain-containing protein, partial [Gemmobacter sp.]|nr:PAS domain-containing protein [Gemmobacter sp.]